MNYKTYKRETAIAIMLAFWIMTGVVTWHARDNVQALIDMVKTLWLPVFSFNALAFGLDWKSKQGLGGEK